MNKSTDPNDPLMSSQEVADLLQIPRATLNNWRYRRQGPTGFRVGRHTRYLRSDVLGWIDAQREADPSANTEAAL